VNKAELLLIGLCCARVPDAAANDFQNAAGAVAGIYAGIYGHELGHAIADKIAGGSDIHIVVPGSQCRLLCGETRAMLPSTATRAEWQAISAAGFIASNLAAQALLQRDSAARSAFGQGFIATNLYSNVSHVVTYYTRIVGVNGYRGNDIDQYARAGGNPHLLSAALLAYSAFALRRMKQRSIPVMFVQLRM